MKRDDPKEREAAGEPAPWMRRLFPVREQPAAVTVSPVETDGPGSDPNYLRLVFRMRDAMEAHPHWKHTDGSPLRNDLSFLAADIAQAYFTEGNRG